MKGKVKLDLFSFKIILSWIALKCPIRRYIELHTTCTHTSTCASRKTWNLLHVLDYLFKFNRTTTFYSVGKSSTFLKSLKKDSDGNYIQKCAIFLNKWTLLDSKSPEFQEVFMKTLTCNINVVCKNHNTRFNYELMN